MVRAPASTQEVGGSTPSPGNRVAQQRCPSTARRDAEPECGECRRDYIGVRGFEPSGVSPDACRRADGFNIDLKEGHDGRAEFRISARRGRRAGQDVDPRRARRRQGASDQLSRAAQMPFIFKHVAAMPDVHVGIGATVGSVIPTKGAVIPAAVGVDIGCGMMAARTSLTAHDLPDNLEGVRSAIEKAVPHGRDVGRGKRDKGPGARRRRPSSRPGRRSPRASSGSPTNTRSWRAPTTSSISARSAPATTSSSSASTRRRASG